MEGRILVAEDENSVRCMLMTALTVAGYSVSCVDNGLDLLRLASSSSDFDIIITDLLLPKGEGNDMLALLRQRGILTPAIVVTAYAGAPVPPGIPVIEKPFRQDALLRAISNLLEAAVRPAQVRRATCRRNRTVQECTACAKCKGGYESVPYKIRHSDDL